MAPALAIAVKSPKVVRDSRLDGESDSRGLRARETWVDSVSLDDHGRDGHCRILLPSQWELVRQMRLAALSESPHAFLGRFKKESQFDESDWRGTFNSASWHGFFIARVIVGIAKSSILAEYPEERYVESFWVRPDHREREVGRRMLQSIVDEAKREQRRVIRLSVLRRNQSAIDAFYRLGLATIVAHRSSEEEICLELPLA
jgi:GNAT superfamily N-acetyltransferase